MGIPIERRVLDHWNLYVFPFLAPEVAHLSLSAIETLHLPRMELERCIAWSCAAMIVYIFVQPGFCEENVPIRSTARFLPPHEWVRWILHGISQQDTSGVSQCQKITSDSISLDGLLTSESGTIESSSNTLSCNFQREISEFHQALEVIGSMFVFRSRSSKYLRSDEPVINSESFRAVERLRDSLPLALRSLLQRSLIVQASERIRLREFGEVCDRMKEWMISHTSEPGSSNTSSMKPTEHRDDMMSSIAGQYETPLEISCAALARDCVSHLRSASEFRDSARLLLPLWQTSVSECISSTHRLLSVSYPREVVSVCGIVSCELAIRGVSNRPFARLPVSVEKRLSVCLSFSLSLSACLNLSHFPCVNLAMTLVLHYCDDFSPSFVYASTAFIRSSHPSLHLPSTSVSDACSWVLSTFEEGAVHPEKPSLDSNDSCTEFTPNLLYLQSDSHPTMESPIIRLLTPWLHRVFAVSELLQWSFARYVPGSNSSLDTLSIDVNDVAVLIRRAVLLSLAEQGGSQNPNFQVLLFS